MEWKTESDLEKLMRQELRRLPLRKAPASLAPRVLAAIQARQQAAWWQRPLWTWPRHTQWLIAFWLLSILATCLSMTYGIAPPVEYPEWMAAWSNAWAVVRDCAEILLNAVIIMLRSIGQPWVLLFLGTGVVMYLFCLGTGTLFYKYAVKRI